MNSCDARTGSQNLYSKTTRAFHASYTIGDSAPCGLRNCVDDIRLRAKQPPQPIYLLEMCTATFVKVMPIKTNNDLIAHHLVHLISATRQEPAPDVVHRGACRTTAG